MGWLFLPDQKLLRWVFRRLSSGQVRLREGWLSILEAWVMCGECFWIIVWGWKALKLKIWYSVNGDLREKVRYWWGPFSAYLGNETPSPFYREGVWMVLGGIGRSLDIIGMWVGGWLELTWGTWKQIASVTIFTAGKFVLAHNMFLEQPKAMRHPAVESGFCHFGQKVISCTWGRVLGLEMF